VDGTDVYWTSGFLPAKSLDGAVTKVGIDGGTPVTIASGLGYPLGLAADATHVYWSDKDGSVMKAPK
jgi:hypothetical protein